MVGIGKMNKAELIARVQELETCVKDQQNLVASATAENKEWAEKYAFNIGVLEASNEQLEKKNEELEKKNKEELEKIAYDRVEEIIQGELEKVAVKVGNDKVKEIEEIIQKARVGKIEELEQKNKELQETIDKWEADDENLTKVMSMVSKEIEEDYPDGWASVDTILEIVETLKGKIEEAEEDAVENYFSDEKLRETSWKEWNTLISRLSEEEEKVAVFESYFNEKHEGYLLISDHFNEWVADVEVKKGKNFHFQLEEDAETGDLVLKVLKDIPAKIEMWERVMESGDSDPELLLDAIAEKFNLTPIEWGKPGCKEKSYELWEKIADIMEEL